MRLGRASIAVCLVLGSLVTGVVWGAKAPGTLLLAWPAYDTQWHKGEGVLDGSKSQQALHMEKVEAEEETPGYSGAVITGFEGATVTELGFDVRIDGLCASAVTFRIKTPEGVIHEFGCLTGLSTPSPDDPVNWTRVRFPHAAGLTIADVRIVFQLPEGDLGQTHLD
ncbi:MAG: hypothetical protein ACRD1T_22415, partial [Acidimicrobiia bacterium]